LDVLKYTIEVLKESIDSAADDNKAFRYAAKRGYLNVLKYLINPLTLLQMIMAHFVLLTVATWTS
jgi:hypothetical protein